MSLKLIDFTGGILSGPINYNFNELNNNIKQERLSTSGYGISYGLETEQKGLMLHFDSGHVILKNGESVDVSNQLIAFDPPEVRKKTWVAIVQNDGKIFLNDVPYTIAGISASTNKDIKVIVGTTEVAVRNVQKNTITIDANYAKLEATITYSVAEARIDNVYVEADGALSIIKGTSSSSPSLRTIEDFCVACVRIDPYYAYIDNLYHAGLVKYEESRHYRNIYTNKNNDLFICGRKLNDFGVVFFKKPEMPREDMIWYNRNDNYLYIFLNGDWEKIGDRSVTSVNEHRLFTPLENSTDLKTFIFHATDEMNMHFIPDKNELNLIIDQYSMFIDQFEEITYEGAINDPTLSGLLPSYGYSGTIDPRYNNVGIGFRLKQPLEAAAYVQAIVCHRVADAALHSRHQRSATFAQTGVVRLEAGKREITFDTPYRFGENQLQLQTSAQNYFEHIDYEEVGGTRGDLSYQIILNNTTTKDTTFHYRITCNVYSYDHISSLLEGSQSL